MAKRPKKGTGVASAWNKAKDKVAEDGGDWIEVPAGGPYPCQLVDAEIADFGGEQKVKTKWCVVSDDEFRGKLLTNFQSIATDESLVWIQRELIAMGVDVDSLTIEKDSDILDVYQSLIDDKVCVLVRVTENGEYLNMRVKKATEVEESLLVDPQDAKKGKVAEEEGGEDEGGEEITLEVGSIITFKRKGKEAQAEVLEFNEDEDPIVKIGKRKVTIPSDDITDATSPESEEPEEPEEEGAEVESDGPQIEVGTKISADFDGEVYEGEVTSNPPGTSEVQCTFSDGEIMMMDPTDLTVLADEEEEPAEEAEEAEEADEGEFSKGDLVLVKLKGSQRKASVEKFDGTHVTVKLDKPVDSKSRFKFKADKVSFQVE